MSAVFAVDACRTPIGKIKGALAEVRPDHLTAQVMAALLARNAWLDPQTIDDVYWGAANQAGEDNRNVARMGVLLAGLPVEVPGATVNRLCGSGMEAISSAARAIAAGDADICIALVSPKMAEMYPPISLGETAENVAEKYGVDRARQDEFALRSHQRAAAARDGGRFGAEIVPVQTPAGTVMADEGIRADLTEADLAAKRPAFKAGGTVTGGNSSPLNDGAAALLLMSQRALTAVGAEPLARYTGSTAAGVHPDYMGIGPVPAMTKALNRSGWQLGDLALVEVNEAFAAQAVAVIEQLKLDRDLVNVNGGAIAIGHPLGCSGARITTTLPVGGGLSRAAARATSGSCDRDDALHRPDQHEPPGQRRRREMRELRTQPDLVPDAAGARAEFVQHAAGRIGDPDRSAADYRRAVGR